MMYKDQVARKKSILSVLLLFSMSLFVSVVLMSFKAETGATKQVGLAVRQSLVQNLATLQQQSRQLINTLEAAQREQTTLVQMQEAFHQTKQAYKKVEYLVEYLDPELAKKLNGAPLPKVLVEEANYQTLQHQKLSIRTFPPEGLQVLEEVLFADALEPEGIKEAVVLAYALQEEIGMVSNSLHNQPLSDKQLLESLREQLIRMMTMGISGFDAPAAGNEIGYVAASLEPVLAAAKLYDAAVAGEAKRYSQQAVQHLQAASVYLQQNPEFETFDRIYFIRELADPAYGALTNLQQHLLPSRTSAATAVNNRATSLFSNDYLQPAYYAKQDRTEQKPELVVLGKVLFFDPVLSANNERSCASCHSPNKAFADGQARSVAFDFKGNVQRNSPSLLNAVFSTVYFWDSRAQYLQDQVPQVLQKEDELHGDYEEVVQKLQQSKAYKQLFKQAFADGADTRISTNTINRAIAAYVQSLVALDSDFDKYMRRETDILSASAKRGFNLFTGKAACATCHFAPIFNGTVPPRFLESESEVLGVTATADFTKPQLDSDLGKAGFIPADAFRHSFKTPTVRNAAATAPYMHNGAFTSLEEVLDFYDLGGGAGMGLDVPNQTLPADPLNLNTQEKNDIIAFIHSLTDISSADSAPKALPAFSAKSELNKRPVGGKY